MKNDCPFCNLHSEKDRVLYETDNVIIMLSSPRLMPGHTLVLPKRHIEKPWELSESEIEDILKHIWLVEQKLLATIATGCDIRQNYRPFLPQGRDKVNHVHFHVLPRTKEDELFQTSMRFETQMFQNLPDDEREEMTKVLS